MVDNNDLEIWDSHVHILPAERHGGLVRWIKRAFPSHPSSADSTPEEILADLHRCGTSTVFNLVFPLKDEETESLNKFSREIADRFENVIPFGSMHSDTPRKDEVAECCIKELGLAGIKLHPYVQGFEAFSPVFKPLFEALNELERPFLVHTGFDVFYKRRQDLGYLEKMLEDYPEMPVVLVHSLFPRFKLAYRLMGAHERLYLDMTNVISAVRYYDDTPPGFWESEAFDEIGENIDYFYQLLGDFSSRIMFGTDHPAGMGSPEQIYEDFDHFEFSPRIRADLLGGTARRLYSEYCERLPSREG